MDHILKYANSMVDEFNGVVKNYIKENEKKLPSNLLVYKTKPMIYIVKPTSEEVKEYVKYLKKRSPKYYKDNKDLVQFFKSFKKIGSDLKDIEDCFYLLDLSWYKKSSETWDEMMGIKGWADDFENNDIKWDNNSVVLFGSDGYDICYDLKTHKLFEFSHETGTQKLNVSYIKDMIKSDYFVDKDYVSEEIPKALKKAARKKK